MRSRDQDKPFCTANSLHNLHNHPNRMDIRKLFNHAVCIPNGLVWAKRLCNELLFFPTNISGHSSKTKHNIKYPDVSSVHKLVFIENIYMFLFLSVTCKQLQQNHQRKVNQKMHDLWKRFSVYLSHDRALHLIEDMQLNDLVRDFKQQSELLASRYHQWNLLAQWTKIISFRRRSINLSGYHLQNAFPKLN